MYYVSAATFLSVLCCTELLSFSRNLLWAFITHCHITHPFVVVIDVCFVTSGPPRITLHSILFARLQAFLEILRKCQLIGNPHIHLSESLVLVFFILPPHHTHFLSHSVLFFNIHLRYTLALYYLYFSFVNVNILAIYVLVRLNPWSLFSSPPPPHFLSHSILFFSLYTCKPFPEIFLWAFTLPIHMSGCLYTFREHGPTTTLVL